jgi:glycosyltransferase involved in cell wall biosynthesis
MQTLLLEGPFESDYSLAVVNGNLAAAMLRMGISVRLHQRDNTTAYFPCSAFLAAHPDLAPLFVDDITTTRPSIHSRNIYPPYTDGFRDGLRVMHSYAWEETVFPQEFVRYFNQGLDLITTVSEFVRSVLLANGVRVPIEVVGNGADHILAVRPKPLSWIRPDTFNFLHVSSCFPRKGPDVLIRAFCAEFTSRDDVRLLIKTFPNPHNEVEKILSEADQEYPRHAPIQVVSTTLDLSEMRYLYENAGCLVSASRGEGFGLPLAEAMLAGCPVIATIYSGQADVARPEYCWQVDYELGPARSHLSEGRSIWANPIQSSLQAQMRNVYRATAQERWNKTQRAREFVLSRFTWDRVAQRQWDYCKSSLASKQRNANGRVPGSDTAKAYIGFVSTWNTKCGIAEYTRYLATNLPAEWRFRVFANRTSEELTRPDEDYVDRCWKLYDPARPQEESIDELAEAILKSGVPAVSVQYNFGFFSPAGLGRLIQRLRWERIVTTVTMHAINHSNFRHLKQAFEGVDFCLCHRQKDVDAIRQLGIENVLLRKQGIISWQLGTNNPWDQVSRLHFVISCFGFFLPPKGIDQLVQAFALAKSVDPMLRLRLLNSLYFAPASTEYASRCIRLIEEKGLAGDVDVCTAFLDPEDTLRELADSDLVVLPYVYSTESSSAAGAFAIASLRPVLCSDLPLFDELSGVVHRFPAGNIFALANKLLRLAGDPAELNRYRSAQEQRVRNLAWPVIAREFAELIGQEIARHKTGRARVVATTNS